jgi:hypothetical protein
MRGRQLYGRYRRRIEILADSTKPSNVWRAELQGILREFQGEVAAEGPKTAHLICEELCDQLEREAWCSVNPHRRDVLISAVKNLE